MATVVPGTGPVAGSCSALNLIQKGETSPVNAFFDAKTPTGMIFVGLMFCPDDSKRWISIPGAAQFQGDRVLFDDCGRVVYRPIARFTKVAKEKLDHEVTALSQLNVLFYIA